MKINNSQNDNIYHFEKKSKAMKQFKNVHCFIFLLILYKNKISYVEEFICFQ